MCVVRLQTGVVPPQSLLERHATQVPFATLQACVAPEHELAFVAEHWPQAPEGWHAGVAPPQSWSAEQGTQVCVTRSQAGVVPLH